MPARVALLTIFRMFFFVFRVCALFGQVVVFVRSPCECICTTPSRFFAVGSPFVHRFVRRLLGTTSTIISINMTKL